MTDKHSRLSSRREWSLVVHWAAQQRRKLVPAAILAFLAASVTVALIEAAPAAAQEELSPLSSPPPQAPPSPQRPVPAPAAVPALPARPALPSAPPVSERPTPPSPLPTSSAPPSPTPSAELPPSSPLPAPSPLPGSDAPAPPGGGDPVLPPGESSVTAAGGPAPVALAPLPPAELPARVTGPSTVPDVTTDVDGLAPLLRRPSAPARGHSSARSFHRLVAPIPTEPTGPKPASPAPWAPLAIVQAGLAAAAAGTPTTRPAAPGALLPTRSLRPWASAPGRRVSPSGDGLQLLRHSAPSRGPPTAHGSNSLRGTVS